MNEGVIFYWIMWMGWVITTFLIIKNLNRTILMFLFLIGIILSGITVSFSLGSINAAFLLGLCIGFVHVIRHHNHLIYHLTGSFFVAITYVSVQIFALYDPAKLIIEKIYILVFVLGVVILLISKRKSDSIPILLIGLFIGDTLYQLLIYRLQGYIEIGSKYVLDLFVMTSTIVVILLVTAEMVKKIKRVTYTKMNAAKQISRY